METRDWNKTSAIKPASGTLCETMNSGGQVQDLRFRDGLWWVPDGTMYVYYEPAFWRPKQAFNEQNSPTNQHPGKTLIRG